MQFRASFAAELRRLREERAFTQEELAERAGLTVKAIGALERGERTRPYPHTVRSLADALSLDESERARLVSAVPSRSRTAEESESSASNQPRLPAPPSPLVGRDVDVDHVCGLVLAGHRLITVTGAGGVGKTRVALEVLGRLAPRYDGVAFVDLASVRDPALLLPNVAAALGIGESAAVTTVAGVVPALAGRRLLVVLDNLEHLLDASVVIAELAARCADLFLVVTSRAALHVRNEREVLLDPLALPEDDSIESVGTAPAARLFLDRATAAGVPLSLDPGTAATVATICRRLDGLPLALELAAAGVRVLTPSALLARLGTHELPEGPRDLSERQRTMTATIAWSLELLGPAEIALFDRLAVFVGGFTLEAVEDVVLDAAVEAGGSGALESLSVLVAHSLVVRTPSPDDQPRFRMLEPIRQFAARRLVSSPVATAVADRHARYFHQRALVAGPALHGPDLRAELDLLEADHANLRAAYVRLLQLERTADAAELVGSLWIYLAARGHAREGLSWGERLNAGMSDAARCHSLIGRMGLAFTIGDLAAMQEDAFRGVELAERLADRERATEVLVLATHAAIAAGDLETADLRVERALALADETGWEWGRAQAHLARIEIALTSGDLVSPAESMDGSLQFARETRNALSVSFALNLAGTVSTLHGHFAAAADRLGESVEVSVEAGLTWTLGYALPTLAGAAVRLGQPGVAAQLFAASASLAASKALDVHWSVTRQLADTNLAQARAELGDLAFADAWDAGRSASLREIAELAGDLRVLARA